MTSLCGGLARFISADISESSLRFPRRAPAPPNTPLGQPGQPVWKGEGQSEKDLLTSAACLAQLSPPPTSPFCLSRGTFAFCHILWASLFLLPSLSCPLLLFSRMSKHPARIPLDIYRELVPWIAEWMALPGSSQHAHFECECQRSHKEEPTCVYTPH